jgi:hypothetical protein
MSMGNRTSTDTAEIVETPLIDPLKKRGTRVDGVTEEDSSWFSWFTSWTGSKTASAAAERANAEAIKAASDAAKAKIARVVPGKPKVKVVEIQKDRATTKKPIVAKRAINKEAIANVEPNVEIVQSSKKSEKTSAKPRDNKLGASNTGGSFVDTANDLLNE